MKNLLKTVALLIPVVVVMSVGSGCNAPTQPQIVKQYIVDSTGDTSEVFNELNAPTIHGIALGMDTNQLRAVSIDDTVRYGGKIGDSDTGVYNTIHGSYFRPGEYTDNDSSPIYVHEYVLNGRTVKMTAFIDSNTMMQLIDSAVYDSFRRKNEFCTSSSTISRVMGIPVDLITETVDVHGNPVYTFINPKPVGAYKIVIYYEYLGHYLMMMVSFL